MLRDLALWMRLNERAPAMLEVEWAAAQLLHTQIRAGSVA